MKIPEINIKEFGATVEQSLGLLACEIDALKIAQQTALKVVHGYGSGGRGGAIALACRQFLMQMKKQKKIKNFFCGGDFYKNQNARLTVLKAYPESAGHFDLSGQNPGVTIILF